HTIRATDTQLDIRWPTVDGLPPVLSERDAAAPTLDEVRASGLLPTWEQTRTFVDELRRGKAT
ncbi:MAG TPA: dTDP-4-dehydrorhamnose 3,5-epimerase, partial [Mycobacterium sp.]|nr:dTDP-4-dehydrorhamnose 3,5-epimerase [Mycobacterium sp.]